MEQFIGYLLSALSLIFVFVAIGFCVFFHELGHFLAGKLLGLHIDAFAIGFKPFWKKKINGVEYRLGYLPFGGYVELPQIDATDQIPKAADGTELPKARPIDRVVTAVAGPLFNIIAGLVIGCVVWFVGLPQDTPKMKEIVVWEVDPSGPEYVAGLRKNDKIVKINGQEFNSTWMQFINKLFFVIGDVELEVERNGESKIIKYTPKPNPKWSQVSKNEGVAWPFFLPVIPIELHPEKGSIAEKAGVKQGDLLVAVDGQNVSELYDFQYLLDNSAGKEVTLTLLRGDERINVIAKPEVIPNLSDEFTRYITGVNIAPTKGDIGALIAGVKANSVAQKANLKVGDLIIGANEQKIKNPAEYISFIAKEKDKKFTLSYIRNGKKETVEIAAKKIVPHTIGLTVSFTEHPNPFEQFVYTLNMSYKSLRGIATYVGNKLGMTENTSSLRPSHMSGPLGIGLVLYNSARHSSFIYAIHFMVIVSFALAIFNLLPLPVLDGGHIFFGLIELITRRAIPVVFMKILASIFIFLLISLMLYVTFFDIKRIGRNMFPSMFEEEKQATEQLVEKVLEQTQGSSVDGK